MDGNCGQGGSGAGPGWDGRDSDTGRARGGTLGTFWGPDVPQSLRESPGSRSGTAPGPAIPAPGAAPLEPQRRGVPARARQGSECWAWELPSLEWSAWNG